MSNHSQVNIVLVPSGSRIGCDTDVLNIMRGMRLSPECLHPSLVGSAAQNLGVPKYGLA
jgi:hypothetical protein